ncbi:hypothetical protein HK100_002434 [Physocladia obscura]|uniref:L domain-like protein n=1 Tax=Physocladia obscura TaxID=109957 RepID=A0AAD5XG64_9FUNG|nr:hypothetical protein HK100_002434 [Physocladia obscura]
MTGAVENWGNELRILNGSIPELPSYLASPTGFFTQLWLSNNNLSGLIPQSLADTIEAVIVANNSHLSGPLPNSVIRPTVNNGEWQLTSTCDFSNTSICVNVTWPYSPSCVRNVSLALPFCGSANLTLIDPNAPAGLTESNGGNGNDNNDSSSSSTFLDALATTVKYAAVGIVVGALGFALFIWFRWRKNRRERQIARVRAQLGDAGGDFELEGGLTSAASVARARELLDLPEYTPQLPDYASIHVPEHSYEMEFLVSNGSAHRKKEENVEPAIEDERAPTEFISIETEFARSISNANIDMDTNLAAYNSSSAIVSADVVGGTQGISYASISKDSPSLTSS